MLETLLPALTSNAARLLRLATKGTIAMGQDADLVVLADDHSVQSVMIGGEWHRKDGEQLVVGNFEQQEKEDN
jgi:beta-aspartyl-dipeptidase (metallo-type)